MEIFAVKLVDADVFTEIKHKLISSLSVEQQAKYTNYKHLDNLQRSLLGELMIRKILSGKLKLDPAHILLKQHEKGKPYLENTDLHFNISHSGKWVIAAFSHNVIGIDIELIREPNYNVAERFYSAYEIQQLNSFSDNELKKLYFFDLWTLKESYLKAIGTGLTKSLSSFTIKIESGFIRITDEQPIENIYFRQYQFDTNYKMAVCSFVTDFCDDIQIIDVFSLIQ
jgi:4'-phosphopantetheinyl transferase